ncbi:MAG: 30S ribosomal protein S12 methylthiotransferase RimO, partial [Lachnospiraceae bacterium]|nr:30S ribosomal protein S12 methylthiotransferase RimO [Lachnospiraceae bacterium]
SLGCDKNLVDSEKLLGRFTEQGYTLTDDEYEADVIVINTCAFINDAKEESIDTILEMAEHKKDGNLKKLIVTGCLSERYKDEFKKELPEVDEIIPMKELFNIKADRIISTPGHYAHLKIAEGCNKNCAYCVIPSIRGKYVSYPMEELVKEAEGLASCGVKELILVAQETTMYGVDLYGKKSLHILLNKLSKIEGLKWIRIMYCYPEEIYDELIEEIKTNEKVCHYIDMPIQHASDEVLRNMNRRTNKAELTERINKLREEIPDIVLRTTLICGFPGETEENHKELKDFVKTIKFDRLGVFTFSPEEGTKAYDMDNQIDEDVKVKYKDDIMSVSENVIAKKGKERIGKTFTCIVEGKVPDEDTYIARSYMDAPDIDGYVFFECNHELLTGAFVEVKITGASEYDLMGELKNELT